MHFSIMMQIRLKETMLAVSAENSRPFNAAPDKATGYIISLAANANNIFEAIKYADEAAFAANPEEEPPPDGTVEKVEAIFVESIENFCPEVKQAAEKARNINGAYYISGRVFFDHADEDKKWWQFWK